MNQPAARHNFNLIRMALDLATGGRPSNIAGKQDALAALAELEARVSMLWAQEPVGVATDSTQTIGTVLHQEIIVVAEIAHGTKLYAYPVPLRGMFTADEMKSAYMNGRSDRAYPDPVSYTWAASATFELINERTE